MNHNPHNLKVGDKVILDNKHEVLLIYMTKQKLISRVEADGEKWDVMTSRLKPKKNVKTPR